MRGVEASEDPYTELVLHEADHDPRLIGGARLYGFGGSESVAARPDRVCPVGDVLHLEVSVRVGAGLVALTGVRDHRDLSVLDIERVAALDPLDVSEQDVVGRPHADGVVCILGGGQGVFAVLVRFDPREVEREHVLRIELHRVGKAPDGVSGVFECEVLALPLGVGELESAVRVGVGGDEYDVLLRIPVLHLDVLHRYVDLIRHVVHESVYRVVRHRRFIGNDRLVRGCGRCEHDQRCDRQNGHRSDEGP